MKRIKMIVHEPLINRIIGSELSLLLHDNANVIDAINEADKQINSKGGFPLPDYQSLLHMVYNPIENRFYKQVAATAHKEPDQTMLNVRDNPKKALPEGTTIILNPTGGCITEWEQALSRKEFLKATSH